MDSLLLHQCSCKRAWLLAFSTLELWFRDGMGETGRQNNRKYMFALQTRLEKKVKLLQSKSSSGRQDSSVSFKSYWETGHKGIATKMNSRRHSDEIYTVPTNSSLSENPIVVSTSILCYLCYEIV